MCNECSFAVDINEVTPEVLAGLLSEYAWYEELVKALSQVAMITGGQTGLSARGLANAM
jgi:hypothetical protein